jgi:hypothetical protein
MLDLLYQLSNGEIKMKKILCILLFLFSFSSLCSAQQVGQIMRGQLPNGNSDFIQLDSNKNLKISGSITTTVDTGALEAGVSSTTTMVQIEGDQTQLAIASVTSGVSTTNSKLDILNASNTASLSAVEAGVSSTTTMVQIEGDQTQLAIASVTNAINSTPTVKIHPFISASQSVILLTDTEFIITLATNSKYINLIATGTFAFSIASTTIDSNTTPIYNATIETFGDMLLSVKRIATDTYLTIREWSN